MYNLKITVNIFHPLSFFPKIIETTWAQFTNDYHFSCVKKCFAMLLV